MHGCSVSLGLRLGLVLCEDLSFDLCLDLGLGCGCGFGFILFFRMGEGGGGGVELSLELPVPPAFRLGFWVRVMIRVYA